MAKQIGELRAKWGRTAEDGSRTLLHGAVAGEESHGRLLHSCEINEGDLAEWVTNEDGQEAQKRVWDEVASELEEIEPGCVKTLLEGNSA